MSDDASPDMLLEEGEPAIVQAAFQGQVEIVLELLEAGATESLAEAFCLGAASSGVVRAFLDRGLFDSSTRRCSVLARGSGSLDEETVERLLDSGADIDRPNEWGRNPLVEAALRRNYPVLRLLLERGADPTGSYNGKPLLHVAQSLEVVCPLLRHGANIDIADDKGRTPTMIAAIVGDLLFLRTASEAGADLNLRDFQGRTALDHAIEKGNLEFAKVLAELGGTGTRSTP